MILLIFEANSQVSGYMGKRFFIQAGFSETPCIYNEYVRSRSDMDSYFYYSYEDLRRKNVYIKQSISLDCNYIVARKVSIGAGLQSFNSRGYYGENNYSNVIFANMQYSGMNYYLFGEYTAQSNHMIFGWYFRAGISISKFSNTAISNVDVITRDTVISSIDDYAQHYTFSHSIPAKYTSFDLGQKFITKGLYWEIGNRTPFSKNLMIHYSISGSILEGNFIGESLTYNNIEQASLRTVGRTNKLSFNLGLVLAI